MMLVLVLVSVLARAMVSVAVLMLLAVYLLMLLQQAWACSLMSHWSELAVSSPWLLALAWSD
jgi:hypothetical protein